MPADRWCRNIKIFSQFVIWEEREWAGMQTVTAKISFIHLRGEREGEVGGATGGEKLPHFSRGTLLLQSNLNLDISISKYVKGLLYLVFYVSNVLSEGPSENSLSSFQPVFQRGGASIPGLHRYCCLF